MLGTTLLPRQSKHDDRAVATATLSLARSLHATLMSYPGAHTTNCAVQHIMPACIGGGIFSAIHAAQGAPISPQLFATNVGAIYAYGALICPMEEITRRRSSMHNFLSGAILGYAGVASQRIGIPFNLELAFHVNRIPLPIGGALVYGGIGMAIALFQGKPL